MELPTYLQNKIFLQAIGLRKLDLCKGIRYSTSPKSRKMLRRVVKEIENHRSRGLEWSIDEDDYIRSFAVHVLQEMPYLEAVE